MIQESNANSIAVYILAGGLGTRLRPVVSDVPKPMAPIAGKPFLDYQIERILAQFPNAKITLLTGYLSDVIEAHFAQNPAVTVIKEEGRLGTGGAILNALKVSNMPANTAFFVFNGDTYITPDLSQFLDAATHAITLVTTKQEDCSRYGALILSGNDITEFREKSLNAHNQYINCGCYLFQNRAFLDSIALSEFSLETELVRHLHEGHSIGAFKYSGPFIDIGIPDDYARMNQYIKDTQ
jgi:D-glycero-alpha-D-manno-heptose 1-phosphate guanylyltransferase